MENEVLSQIGAGGLIAIIIVRDVIKFLSDKKSPEKNGAGEKMRHEVHDLWVWHNHEDVNGVKSWYTPAENRRKLENIEKLLEKIARGERGK
jgi:hypothetical protein